MQLVIDKSYLQGTSAENLQAHVSHHTILFPESLLYELLTTEREAVRRTCLTKLTHINGSIKLLPSTGPLFQHEIVHQQPAYPVIDHTLPITFQDLVAGVASCPLDEQLALGQWKLEVRREVEAFDLVAKSLAEWCPELKTAKRSVLGQACGELKEQACTDADVVRRIYGSLGLEDFPRASLIDPAWITFRWVQMHILFGLDHISRYGFGNLDGIPKRVEHDVHDFQYALFGTLCGGLATTDLGIKQNFRLACPYGFLLSQHNDQ